MGEQIKGLLEIHKAALKLMLGMCCLLQQGAYDEQQVCCTVILSETNLASGSALTFLSPSSCPCFKYHCIKFEQSNNNCDASVISRIVSVSSFVDWMNETNAPGGGEHPYPESG